MGNGLDPYEKFPEQTEEEYKLMVKLFGEKATLDIFFA
jgi:hypothetical protein